MSILIEAVIDLNLSKGIQDRFAYIFCSLSHSQSILRREETMLWLVAIAASLIFWLWGRRLQIVDEVYSVALYISAVISGLWGFWIAPAEAQLTVAFLTLIGVRRLPR